MLQDIREVLISKEAIEAKTKELAERISRDYKGKDLLVVGVLKGSVIFASELIKNITIPCEIDFMAVSSYGSSSETTGVVRILKDLDSEISGKHILIVEDIVDSGVTLSYLLNVSIKTVSYLDIMDFSLDSNENLVGFYDNSGIFVAKYINHRLTGKYEYIKKRELNSNEFSNLKTDVIIDYSKIYNLTSKLPKIDPKQVNPIYVKKISVEYD